MDSFLYSDQENFSFITKRQFHVGQYFILECISPPSFIYLIFKVVLLVLEKKGEKEKHQ